MTLADLRPPRVVLLTAIVLPFGSLAIAADAPGGEIVKTRCTACHGPDASGKTPIGEKMKVRDLQSTEVQKQSDAELTAIVAVGKGTTPAFGKTLDPSQIRDVVNIILLMGF